MSGACGSSKPKTRHSSGSKWKDFIGPAKEFNPSEVPTLRAVLQKGLLLKDEKHIIEGVAIGHYTKGQIARDLAPLVMAQWEKANPQFKTPVIIKENTLVKKIERLWQRAEDIIYGRKGKKDREILENYLDRLLDLTVCPHNIKFCQEPGSECVDPIDCELEAHILCTCPLPIQIPKMELVWLHSQRNKIGELSKYQITGNNSNEIKRLERKMKR